MCTKIVIMKACMQNHGLSWGIRLLIELVLLKNKRRKRKRERMKMYGSAKEQMVPAFSIQFSFWKSIMKSPLTPVHIVYTAQME